MPTRNLFIFATLLAGLALLLTPLLSSKKGSSSSQPPAGRNNTILFLSNSEYGLANVLLATSHALLVRHSEVDVHFASFKKRKADITAISRFAQAQEPRARGISFHELTGPTYGDALNARGHFVAETIHKPGVVGSGKLCTDLQKYLMPWDGPEYHALYEQISQIIEEVNPAIIALDPQFGPGLDATKDKNKRHAIVSPNGLKDNFAHLQPWGSMFWKYPALGSGIAYPVPWSLIPANIYMNLRFIYSVMMTPELKEKRKYLKERGVANPSDFFNIYNDDIKWICQSSPYAEFPMSVIPDNVKACGPIYLSTAAAAEQDLELAEWLKRAPTLLINLGSTTDYDEKSATEMAGAIKSILEHTDVQVLWKFNRRKYMDSEKSFSVTEFSDGFLGSLKEHLGSRLRMENWIKIDPAAMMKTGNIIASVHHGGANCYHEAIGNGIPQIVLPMWVDLYDYATRAEWLGVGVWGNKATAPDWTAEELSIAFMKVLGDTQEARGIREKAKRLGLLFEEKPGQYCAAEELAKMAGLGVEES